MSRGSRHLLRVLLALGTLSALWIASAAIALHGLTRRPVPLFPEPPPEIGWGRIEEHRLATSDGEELEGWFVRGPEMGPSVVVLHGQGGCCAASLSRAELLAQHGASPLMLSLRAHGASTGSENDFGWSARADVLAAVDFLEGARPGRPVLVLGTSLGAAAAAFAAQELRERVSGYILEQPYRDLSSAAWHRLEAALPPAFDRIAHAGMNLVGPLFLPDIARMAPVDAVQSVPASIPVWVLAGGRDQLAPLDETSAVAAAHPGASRLIVFSDAGHDSLLAADRGLYERTLTEWLAAAGGMLSPAPR